MSDVNSSGSGSSFRTMDINEVGRALMDLHEQIVSRNGRVEITSGDGSGQRSVIISKAELQSLERALEILSDSEGVQAMAQSLSKLCAQVEHHDDAQPHTTLAHAQ